MPGLGGQAKAWLQHKVPGAPVFSCLHTQHPSAHTPPPACSRLPWLEPLKTSQNWATSQGFLKVTSLPPRAQRGPSQSPSLTAGDYHITTWQEPGTSSTSVCLGWGETRTAPHCPALHPRESIGPALCLSSRSARPGWGSRAPHDSHEHGILMPPPPGLGDMHRTLGWIGSTHTPLLVKNRNLGGLEKKPSCVEFKFSCVTQREQFKHVGPILILTKCQNNSIQCPGLLGG